VDVDEPTVVEHTEGVVEQATIHQELLAGMASGNLVVDGVHRDDVVGADGALYVKHEVASELLITFRHSQGALVGAETLVRGEPAQAFVGLVVVDLTQIVLQAQRKSAGVWIDVGSSVVTTQYVVLGGLVELLDLAVSFGVGRLTVNQ